MPAGEWECVVVNNNSTDDTPARFAAFAARYPALNLRMVTETGPGVSYARNRGIAETSAPYMAFIDDDERINAGFIRRMPNSSTHIPMPSWPGGASLPSMSRDVRRGCRNIPNCLSPTRWISAMPYGLFLPDVFPGEATWLSAAPQPSDTAGSTLRWGVWEGC